MVRIMFININFFTESYSVYVGEILPEDTICSFINSGLIMKNQLIIYLISSTF